MKFDIGEHSILYIAKEYESTKEYSHVLESSVFSLENFQLPVYHKRKIRIIEWKELGDKMQVFVSIPKREQQDLDLASFEYAFDLFQGFDEVTGNKYSFLYRITTDKITKIQFLLEKHNIEIVEKDGIFTKTSTHEQPKNVDALSLLFGLFIIYGGFQTKSDKILGAKTFLPLFGSYLSQKDQFLHYIHSLEEQKYYIHYDCQKTNDGELLQLSITDHEILQLFASWYLGIENNFEITKLTELEKAKYALQIFMDENNISSSKILSDQLKLLSK